MLLTIKLFQGLALEISHLKLDSEKAVVDCGDLNRV